jgi:4-aminobutyrate aminotransferase-like enzyme
MGRHKSIGDVRGRGLFLGIELVTDRVTKEPATQVAARVVDACLARGVLLGTDGPHDNVLKLRPQMTFQVQHHDLLVSVLDEALGEAGTP